MKFHESQYILQQLLTPVVISNAALYCGDCLDILPHLSGIDAVVSARRGWTWTPIPPPDT